MFHTTLGLAGLSLALRVRGPFDVARFRHRFGPYEIDSATADAALDLYVEPQGTLLLPDDVPYPGVKAYPTPEGVKLLREGLSMWVPARGATEAWVRGPEKIPAPPHEEDGGAAETPLRILTSLLLLSSGRGALFHACGHADERGGLLLLGQSGAGKTTLARLLPPASALSDDQVALVRGERPAVASTPFVGVLGRTIPPLRAPLRAIVVLDHERRGLLAPVPARERLGLLLGCLPLYARAPAFAAAALDLVSELGAVPMLRGSIDLDEGAGPWLDRIHALVAPG